VRVVDAADGTPADSSDAAFSILAPIVVVTPDSLDFGPRGLATTALDSLCVANTGTAPFAGVAAIEGIGFALADADSLLPAGPDSLALAPRDSAWVRIEFAPLTVSAYAGSLTVSGNAALAAQAALAGEGVEIAALQLLSPDGGEAWQYNTVHDITWTSAVVQLLQIAWQDSAGGAWSVIADSVVASPPHYAWTAPASSTTTARVRLVEVGGVLADSSTAPFSILVPGYAASVDTIEVGQVTVGASGMQSVVISNPGTAPLAILSVSDDSPDFNAGRSSFAIPPSAIDTLGVYFTPSSLGEVVAQFSLASDDPGSPHALVARGTGVAPSDAGGLPTTYALGHDGPNPFLGSTTLRYRLPERARVSIEVYSPQGRRVATLVSATQGPGEYAVPFGSGVRAPAGHVGPLAAGVYFVKMEAGPFAKTYKLILAR